MQLGDIVSIYRAIYVRIETPHYATDTNGRGQWWLMRFETRFVGWLSRKDKDWELVTDIFREESNETS